MTFILHSRLAADSYHLGDFELCRLLLIRDSQYPWFVLVPRRKDICEIYQLCDADQVMLWQESRLLSEAIMTIFNGDKLNMAALGNMVPQLHLHHIVRFHGDPSWPAPIWGKLPMQDYQTGQVEVIQQKLAEKLVGLSLNTLG